VAEQPVSRRLAGILGADVVGYSYRSDSISRAVAYVGGRLQQRRAFRGRRRTKELGMKKAIVVMIGVILLSSSLSVAAKEQRITGYVSSIDSEARKITLSEDATYPLNPNSDIRWIQPGMKVTLICQYDALVIVGCGVGFASLSKDRREK
jgi:Protein of unknown function (DUF1344)